MTSPRRAKSRPSGDANDRRAPDQTVYFYRDNPPHANAGKLFIDFLLSRETQKLIKNLGRVVSRADIVQDDLGRFKLIADDITLAERINPLMEECIKYLE